jgi:hypothetical protein
MLGVGIGQPRTQGISSWGEKTLNRPQNILRLFKSIPSPLISMLKPTVLIQNEHKVTLRTATVLLAVEI